MTDKEFLLDLSSAFDKAECSEPGIIKITKELADVIASRVKEIAEKILHPPIPISRVLGCFGTGVPFLL